jgi:hypothetical protein
VAADFASASYAPTCSANPLVRKIDFHCHAFPAEFFEAKEQTLSGTKNSSGGRTDEASSCGRTFRSLCEITNRSVEEIDRTRVDV